MSINTQLSSIIGKLTPATQLVAVSKYHPAEALLEAYNVGQRIFGESHVQELCAKREMLPHDISWHFIGHLQTNKVKYIAPFVSLIHAVDSIKLLKEIDKQAKRCERVIPCLLQIHIAKEDTKFGFLPNEIDEVLAEGTWRKLENISICGLMCMATNTDDTSQVRAEFRLAKKLFDEIKARYFASDSDFKELSMGMSGDWEIAAEEGSTLVRVGSMIFGQREYN